MAQSTEGAEASVESPVTHLMFGPFDSLTGCCMRAVADLPTDGSHLVTERPLYRTCDGSGNRRRAEVSR